jgi:hypothetical protein
MGIGDLVIRDVARLWDPQPGWLNTAGYGLPPRPAWSALQEALSDWRHGRVTPDGWDASTGRARAAFARLVGVEAGRFDVLACAAYKWLMAPRGVAFCYVAPDVRDRFRPLQANWYAGEEHAHYGPPLWPAASARRFDTSPAWFSYVGAVPALELINESGDPGGGA